MLTRLLAYVKGLLRRNAINAEVDEELGFHVEMETQANIGRGMSPVEARRVALRDLGGVTQTRESIRGVRTLWIEPLLQDVRYALRSFVRTPGFTAVVVLTLALGIGLNTGLFVIVNAVLIRPLPFPAADRLVSIGGITLNNDLRGFDRAVFASLAHFGAGAADLTDVGDATRVAACSVTTRFFSTFGVQPQIGRDFREGEGADGAADVVVISDGFWKRQFGGTADALGAGVRLNGKSHRIIGVAPRGFTFPGSTDIWMASDFGGARFYLYRRPDETGPQMGTMGRLQPNVSIERARVAAQEAQRNFEDEIGRRTERRTGHSDVGLAPLHDRLVRDARPSLLMLFGAVGFVLLVACANVTNMLYARGARRRQELAIRASLGAGRMRLARQLLTESLLLSMLGGLAGLVIAVWTTKTFAVLAPANFPGFTGAGSSPPLLDLRVFAFAVAACMLAGVIGGLAPSRLLLNSGPARSKLTLSVTSRTATWGAPRTRLRSGLIFVQVAACVVLVVGAGLMIRSLVALQQADPGFDAENVVTMQISLPTPAGLSRTDTHQHALLQLRALVDRLSGVRQVQAFAMADQLPLDPSGAHGQFFEVEPPRTPPLPYRTAVTINVSAGYFKAMGIRVLRGRAFTDEEVAAERPVAVVDEDLAARYWPGVDAVGKRIKVAEDWHEVVGVARNVPYSGPAASAKEHTDLQIYVPGAGGFFVFRSTLTPSALVSIIRDDVRRLERNAVITRVRAMSDLAAVSNASPRTRGTLLAMFAALALLLAAVGIYGVASYVAAERTHEIGVRVALGAGRKDIVWMVLRQAVMPVALGLVGGIGLALAGGRLLRSFLFGVAPTDGAALLFAAGITAAVGLLAAYIPARRATRIDPIQALRCE